MSIKIVRFLLIVGYLFFVVNLNSCGQTGPLYLPDDKTPTDSQAPS